MGDQQDRSDPSAAAAPWIVINSHPHREQLALENLQRQQFDAYCPMLRRRVSHARRVTTALRPLFPGYLFVRTGPTFRRWRPILSTYGVRNVVRAGDALSFIDDAFISGLKAREIDGVIVRPTSPYQVGQSVRIAAGPFDRLIATIIELGEKDRLVVLIDLLNRPTKVTLASTAVTAA
jgi:transcriptional antiterminator RfaH